MKRNELLLLHPSEYEHEFDRKALQTLEGTPGFEKLVRKVFKLGVERYFRLLQTGSYIKVNPNNFPEIYNILKLACENLYLEKIPDLYVKWDYQINASALGSENPIITLNSGTIDLLSDEELLYIIGHECGHVKSGHMLYHTIALLFPFLGDVAGSATLGMGSLFSAPINYALLYWSRMSEFSADRAGLLACQNKEAAISAMMKLGGVPKKFYDTMDTDDFIKQSQEFRNFDYDTADKVFKIVMALDKTHPLNVLRASELLKWVNEGQYQNIINKHTGDLKYLELICFKCGFRMTGTETFCGNCGVKIAGR